MWLGNICLELKLWTCFYSQTEHLSRKYWNMMWASSHIYNNFPLYIHFHHTLIGISFLHIAQMSLSLPVIIWLILLKYTHTLTHGAAVYPLSWQQLLKGRKGDMTGSLSAQWNIKATKDLIHPPSPQNTFFPIHFINTFFFLSSSIQWRLTLI